MAFRIFADASFSTVAVDTFDLRGIGNKEERLSIELRRKENWPALVFVSAPDRANKLATQLALGGNFLGSSQFSDWIDENFGAGWELSKTVAAGIGVHHGRMPRAVASHFVRVLMRGNCQYYCARPLS